MTYDGPYQVIPLVDGTNTNDTFGTDQEYSFIITKLTPQLFVSLMNQYKALLFRHIETECSIDDFGSFVVAQQLTYYPYVGGAAPRTIIPVAASPEQPIVFTSNESPPDQPIPFHHELAQTLQPPHYIFFYCDVAAQSGGETPLIDSTVVYRYVKEHHPDFLQQLETKSVRYIRTLPYETDLSSPIGRSYRDTYHVTSREELDRKLSTMEGDYQWEWLDETMTSSVRVTSPPIPAIRLITDDGTHEYIYQSTFFNSVIAAYVGWEDVRNNRYDAIRYGDMTPMDHHILDDIAEFMSSHRMMYPWKHGDIMAIQNQLVMHSRNPYTGPRRVLASIWGPSTILDEQPPHGIAMGIRPPYRPLQPADPCIFGFWKVPQEICANVCYDAIRAGYRRLDCACDYGNETQVGIGIQRAIADGLCTRHDLFITSKLWNTYHEPQYVKMACQKSLSDLQLDYLDEYLIHFPISMPYIPFDKKYPPEWTNLDNEMIIIPNDMTKTWHAMEQLVHDGLCHNIGICNFTIQLIRQLLSTYQSIRPSTLQIEIHPHHTQEKIIRFARDVGMTVTAFSCLGATSYVSLGMATEQQSLLHHHPVMDELAKKYHKTSAQLLIRWAIQRQTMPLCKTITYERMIENRNVYDFAINQTDMKRISSLNQNQRYNDPGVFCEAGMNTYCPIYE